MKTRNFIFSLLCMFFFHVNINAQSTLALVESGEGCGLLTDCSANTICLDIMLTPGVTATVQSYNIWVQYTGSGLSYLSDNACITQNGTDNNLDSLYRVSGIQGVTQVTAGVEVALHTICFTYSAIADLDNQLISVGGTVFEVLHSTLTYNSPPSNEGMMPEFPFLMDETSISCIEPLAVHLVSFDARKAGTTAVLNWLTVTDEQLDGFEIERSVNGITFESIGAVPGKAVSQGSQTYAFIDSKPLNGVNYYRLKYLSSQGATSYSPIRSLLFGDTGYVVNIWPNPVSNSLFLNVHTTDETPVAVTILNSSGQLVFARQWQSGFNQEGIDVSAFSPGVYHLLVDTSLGRHVEKIVVID